MLTVEGYAYIGEVAQSNSSDAANVICKYCQGLVCRSHVFIFRTHANDEQSLLEPTKAGSATPTPRCRPTLLL